MVPSGFRRCGNLSFNIQFSKKCHWLASTASDRKDDRYQWKIGFLMIHFTKWDIWVLRMIQSSGWVNFSMKWGCWGHWGHRGCCGRRGHWCCRGYKAWQIATEDFSVIQVLKLVLIWCFEKRKKKWGTIRKYHVEF